MDEYDETGAPVRIERAGPVLSVIINRPEQNNALNAEVREALLGVLRAARADAGVRVLVLRAAGEEAFSTGLDIQELATLSPREAEDLAFKMRALMDALAALDMPSIALIKGACIGSGLELAMHCDLRFSRTDARFAFPGINVGIVPGGASVRRLAQLIGAGPAQALLLTGSLINAERAFMLGLVTNIIPPNAWDEAVGEFTQYLANLPPVAVREVKGLLRLALDGDQAALVVKGAEALKRCFAEGEALALLRQFYAGPGAKTTYH